MPATVDGLTEAGRVRILFDTPKGIVKRVVAPHSLTRQMELAL